MTFQRKKKPLQIHSTDASLYFMNAFVVVTALILFPDFRCSFSYVATVYGTSIAALIIAYVGVCKPTTPTTQWRQVNVGYIIAFARDLLR